MTRQDFERESFEAKNRLRGGASASYRSRAARTGWSRARVADHAAAESAALVRYATANSAFYRERAAGAVDLADVPVLRRQDLVESFEEIRVDAWESMPRHLGVTGGTSGVPVKVLLDGSSYPETIGWRVLRSWGLHPGDSMAVVNREIRSGFGAWVNRVQWYPTRHVRLNAAQMTNDRLLAFVRELARRRYPILVGYAGGVYELARFIAEEGLTVQSPAVVWVTASPLSENQRRTIASVFSAPVMDQYGAVEVNWIAAQCTMSDGLHVQEDCRVVEILGDDARPLPPGQVGRIVVTDLLNRVFPLLRYEIGDRGSWLPGDCACGSPFPRLDRIQGRVSDVFRFTDGTRIGGEFLTTIFDDFPDAVEAFKIHQERSDFVRLSVVPTTRSASVAEIDVVYSRLLGLLAGRADLALEYVERIPHERGKQRFVVSDIS